MSFDPVKQRLMRAALKLTVGEQRRLAQLAPCLLPALGPLEKFQFSYGYWSGATVTVKANSYADAVGKARAEMDRRYAKRDMEPPVGWTLTLLKREVMLTKDK